MSKLRTLLLCRALAGIVLTVPVAAQIGVASHFSEDSATQPTQLAMAVLQDQNPAPHQELRNGSGDKQPASAASSDNANNSSASRTETKDRKKKSKKKEANPAPSDQDEQFKRVLLGIYG